MMFREIGLFLIIELISIECQMSLIGPATTIFVNKQIDLIM